MVGEPVVGLKKLARKKIHIYVRNPLKVRTRVIGIIGDTASNGCLNSKE
jgi:hypothetical protein